MPPHMTFMSHDIDFCDTMAKTNDIHVWYHNINSVIYIWGGFQNDILNCQAIPFFKPTAFYTTETRSVYVNYSSVSLNLKL